jgi:mono/diheme cytochrome c family protein
MKQVAGAALLSILVAFSSCETVSSIAPTVTPVMLSKDADPQFLTEGRNLFVSRCIDCHSLPPISKYSSERWPHLIEKMSGRAHLQPTQRDAIVAYILAARAQSR